MTLGYVEELGRVLKPGAWAAFALSTDPRVHSAAGPSRRGRAAATCCAAWPAAPAEREAPAAAGSAVPLDALGAVATSAGLTLEDIEGAGTQQTLVRATRTRAS